uniref:Ribosomal protein S16 n=1 Tax=Populus trichocarpa TaxID=3694 RepID=B9N2F2_POPTR
MAVKIRLARLGCKNRAFYRIFAADTHTPRDGKHLQVVGFYDHLAGYHCPSIKKRIGPIPRPFLSPSI